MLVLLPPSEAKVPGGDGPPVRDLLSGTEPRLARSRLRVLREVAALAGRRDRRRAADALLLPAGVVDEACDADAQVLDSPTTPALDRYSGVVYAGLDAGSLSAAARRVADSSVLVFSGAFGVVHGDEPVPLYRVPAAARLPRCGLLSAYWRPFLARHLPPLVDAQLVIDLRSSDYASMWAAPPALREQVVAVRVLQQRRDPSGLVEKVVSYHSKELKGRLARALVQAAARRRRVDSVDSLAEVAAGLGLDPRPVATTRGQALDLVDPLRGA